MKVSSLPFFFVFTFLLDFCFCGSTKIQTVLDGNYLPAVPDYPFFTTRAVLLSRLNAMTGPNTKVTVESTSYDLHGKIIGKSSEEVDTGADFTIQRRPKATARIILHFVPLNQADYIMETPTITVEFEPFPFDRIITPEEQPAVARDLSIAGKFVDLTRN